MDLKLTHDVYNISKRIKLIEKDYYIVYNTSKQKFEVHNSSQMGGTYCLTLPYSELDERALNYVAKTKSENIERILADLENHNQINKNAKQRETLSKINELVLDNFKEN